MKIAKALLFASSLAGAASAASNQPPITVQLSGLSCSTTAGSNTFSVLSWSFGASNPASVVQTAAGGAGKVSLQNLVVMKEFDGCSTVLFEAAATGKSMTTVTLVQIDPSTNQQLMKVTLQNVLVSSYSVSGNATATTGPVESVSFTYAKIQIVNPQNNSTASWNLATNSAN